MFASCSGKVVTQASDTVHHFPPAQYLTKCEADASDPELTSDIIKDFLTLKKKYAQVCTRVDGLRSWEAGERGATPPRTPR